MKNGVHRIAIGQNSSNHSGCTDHQHGGKGRGHSLHKLGDHLIDGQTAHQRDDNPHIQEDGCDLAEPPAVLQYSIDHQGKPCQHQQQHQHGALVHAFQLIQSGGAVHFPLFAV